MRAARLHGVHVAVCEWLFYYPLPVLLACLAACSLAAPVHHGSHVFNVFRGDDLDNGPGHSLLCQRDQCIRSRALMPDGNYYDFCSQYCKQWNSLMCNSDGRRKMCPVDPSGRHGGFYLYCSSVCLRWDLKATSGLGEFHPYCENVDYSMPPQCQQPGCTGYCVLEPEGS